MLRQRKEELKEEIAKRANATKPMNDEYESAIQALFHVQPTSGSGSQPPFTNPSQHDEENEDEDEEYDDPNLKD